MININRNKNLDKKYILLFSLFILNTSSQITFSEINPIKSKNYKHDENIKLEKKLIFKENTNNLNKLLENTFILLAENIGNQNEFNNESLKTAEILSDTQLNNEEFTIAEGNVYVNFKNMSLKADKLEFNRKTKNLKIIGEIKFKSNNQFLDASKIEYNFKRNEGFIENAYGSINFDALNNMDPKGNKTTNKNKFQDDNYTIKNVKLNQTSSIEFKDFNLENKEESFFEGALPKTLDADINEMQNWRFVSERIEIKNGLWSAEKLFITNDPFNKPQLIIKNSGFSTIEENNEMIVKSKWSTIELDNFLKIPTGPRRYNSRKKNKLRWEIGYDEKGKDGLFIARNSDTIFLEKDKTTLDLKKVFLIQRAISEKTKSYSKSNDSVLGEKVEQDTKVSDYLGLEAELNSQLFDFDFYSNVELSSLDFDKFKKIISINSEFSKVIHEENKKDMEKKNILSFFGNYRDKIWNGSFGQVEILGSYGTRIEKLNIWQSNNIKKSSKIKLEYGNYKSGKFNDKTQSIDRKRLNISLLRNHKYPIWEREVPEFITNEDKYSPYVIPVGINLFIETRADFYRYDDYNFQNLYTLQGGPEITLGQFKKKYLDYTKIQISPKATITSGQSPFQFDQANDKHQVEFMIEQQLIGPITLKFSTDYNLDINSSNYKEFQDKRFEIALNRRAYNLSAYYSEDNKTGGITFKIHSFNFDGLGETFK